MWSALQHGLSQWERLRKDLNKAAWNSPQKWLNIWANSRPQWPHAHVWRCPHTHPGRVWPFSRGKKKKTHRNQTIQWRENTHSGSVWRPLRSLPKATGMSSTAFLSTNTSIKFCYLISPIPHHSPPLSLLHMIIMASPALQKKILGFLGSACW